MYGSLELRSTRRSQKVSQSRLMIARSSLHAWQRLPALALLLGATALAPRLSLADAGAPAVLVPVVTAATFEGCRGDGASRFNSTLPLYLAVSSEHIAELSIELHLQWVSYPIKISFDVKDHERPTLLAEVSGSLYSIPVRDDGWISIALLPSGETSLLLAVQSETERSDAAVATVHSVLIPDLSHVATGQAVGLSSSCTSALDVSCLRDVGDAAAAAEAVVGEPSLQSSLPLHVVVPVVVCAVFIVVIIVLSLLFVWQRHELKKRKNSYQQTILRKQEELQQFNRTRRSDETPQVPPRAPCSSSRTITASLSDDEESRQLRPMEAGGGATTAVRPKPRSYIRDEIRPQMVHQISRNFDTNKPEGTNPKFESFSKIIKGRSPTSSNAASKPPEVKSNLPVGSGQRTLDIDEEDEGGFNGPYWHHSLRQPPSKFLKTYQV